MESAALKGHWIWHPEWIETARDTAGGFVHFRKSIIVPEQLRDPVTVQISADTKYKLFVNGELVSFGPVKGDQNLWFYDEVDISPFLKTGRNQIAVRVLRLYYATHFATSFPRLQSPGMLVRFAKAEFGSKVGVQTDTSWETALDVSSHLPVGINEDDFLHIYEDVNYQRNLKLKWMSAAVLDLPASHGLTPPWKLSPRLIPKARLSPSRFRALHNIQSSSSLVDLERTLLEGDGSGVCLRAGTSHHIEIEALHHVTAFLAFRFDRPSLGGSILRITYSECYEDEPFSTPYLRSKGDRCDTSKRLLGPQDVYIFGGQDKAEVARELWYDELEHEEAFRPFHFRTLRFMTLDIQVAENSDLILRGIDLTLNNYPLDVRAEFDFSGDTKCYKDIWSASLRTLCNCLHDCYEDCPFYEQLQYVMDTRSSILFTYAVSNDDRLARQAIVQLHNSYLPSLGLTASRAPAHQLQIIPHFSLYWICMVQDHFEYFGDSDFVRQFCHTCDGVLETFARNVHPELGLVRHDPISPHWLFVDWTESWKPMGIPSAGTRTGYLTYTSMLYAYALKAAANLASGVGRCGMAEEYTSRAKMLVEAVRTYCFDGQFFTDGLAAHADLAHDYSQHAQIWAVLSGAATEELATTILERSFCPAAVKRVGASPTLPSTPAQPILFSPVSTAMSFYALRAFSCAGPRVYNAHFHEFWHPWRLQLARNLTTWEEDSVSQRSDCHAWGCAALYEFPREVAGIRPGAPGWKSISWEPQLGLFRDFKGQVPFGGGLHCGKGLATVEWHAMPERSGYVQVILKFDVGSATRGEHHRSAAY